MKDFLTFQTFIAPTFFMFIYYVGAMLIPILSWYLTRWIKKSYFSEVFEKIKEEMQIAMLSKQYVITTVTFFIFFFCMEIFWRVMFEFFIAYFDMHDALMHLCN